MRRSFDIDDVIHKYDEVQETRKWMRELPALHFKKEWDVHIIPPFGGAVIRFWIDYNEKHVSVYFDGYNDLGWMEDESGNRIPYFEYYNGDECYRYELGETNKMMEDITAFLES